MNKNSFLIELSESENTDHGRIDFAVQNELQKVFSAIWELESQVNNGGFDQYFSNSDWDIVAYAPTALRTIGADSCARVVERAIKAVTPLTITPEGISKALEQARDRLEALDSEFYEYPDDLTELLHAFVNKHPEAFDRRPKN